jgi:hypothetical protein
LSFVGQNDRLLGFEIGVGNSSDDDASHSLLYRMILEGPATMDPTRTGSVDADNFEAVGECVAIRISLSVVPFDFGQLESALRVRGY